MKYGDNANICLEHYFFFCTIQQVSCIHEPEAKDLQMGSKIPEFQNIFNKRSQDGFCAIQAIIFHKRVASKKKCAKKYKNRKARGVL
jgi:hypothetical protein